MKKLTKKIIKNSPRLSHKPKFIKLTIDVVRKKYLNGEKTIRYYYADGANPNKVTKKHLHENILTQNYYFIPSGNLIILCPCGC